MERGGLRIVAGGAAAEAVGTSPDPAAFQEECLRAFGASQVARGFSELTIVNGSGTLQRFLDACGRPAWEVTREDVDRVVGELAAQGLAASTRRGYVQAFKNFHAFLAVRKAAEIEAAFGIRLEDPVDEFNAARHVSADSPAAEPPPGPERLEDFFAFLRERIAGAAPDGVRSSRIRRDGRQTESRDRYNDCRTSGVRGLNCKTLCLTVQAWPTRSPFAPMTRPSTPSTC